jgi:integrase
MSRPNSGPKLVPVRKKGWSRSMFYIRWTENGRSREHATGESDPVRAEEVFAEWLAERRRERRSGPSDPDQVLVREVIEDYAIEHGGEVAGKDAMSFGGTALLAFFRDDTMADLTPNRVKAYWTWRRAHSVRTEDGQSMVVARKTSDGTIIRELAGILRPAIKHAMDHKRLKFGAYSVPVPQAPPGREYWITRSDAARLLREACRDTRSRLHLPLYILIALYTGQRRGAILDLTWKQIDLVAGVIDFNPPGRRQTKKTRPRIPIPRSLLAALRRAHKRATVEFVIAYNGEKVLSVKKGFGSAARRAGIPRCTSHTLRHSAGTMMANRGVSLREIGGYLGHSETRTTELYAHHSPAHLAKAKGAMEGRK